ncbi:MAG: DUF721 domain-containing protein [Candidatus Babeliales bacterium]
MAKPIQALLSQFIVADQQWKTELLQQWDALMGNLAQHVTIIKIEQQTLLLGVYDSSWMQELHLLSEMLLIKINAQYEAPRIKKLRFILTKKARSKKAPAPIAASKKILALSAQEEKTLNNIEDPELKIVLKEFLVRCKK